MPSLELLAELEGHTDRVWQVHWHPTRLELVSCSGDKTARIWTAATPTGPWICACVLDGAHQRAIRSVAYAPLGKAIATASFDASTGVWERDSDGDGDYECVATLEGHENEVKSVAWSSNGALLATCSRDKSVWIWEADQDSGDFECLSVLQEHTQDVKMVVWHPKEELLASASYDDTIRTWKEDDDDWYCASTLSGHQSTVWAIDFDQEGHHMVSGSDDKTLKVWRRETPKSDTNSSVFVPQRQEPSWRCVSTISGEHQRCIYSVSWSKINGHVATASGDNHLRVFSPVELNGDPTDRKLTLELCVAQPNAHGVNDLNSVAWSPLTDHSQLLASGGDDGIVRIWKFVR